MQSVLTLPWPPRVNHYWVASGHRRYISKEGCAFKADVMVAVLKTQCHKFNDDPVTLTIMLNPPNKRRSDIDNRLKALLDSLQSAKVFNDDYQVQKITIERGPIVKDGSCTVTIEG